MVNGFTTSDIIDHSIFSDGGSKLNGEHELVPPGRVFTKHKVFEHVLLFNLDSFISSLALRSDLNEARLLFRKFSTPSGVFQLHNEMH